jgi:murein DD-endopeptidase MepM/ murein hydrolase activator NlpD
VVGTAAGSLKAKARAVAGTSAARTAAATATTARTAAKAAGRAASAARAAAATRSAARSGTASQVPAAPAVAVEPVAEPVAAAPVRRPTPHPRTPAVAEQPVAEQPVAEPAPAAVPAFVDEALSGLQSAPAGIVPVLADAHPGLPGAPAVPASRRPAFLVAAGLAGVLAVGMLVDGDPSAAAEPAVTETMSVAEQLGITAEPTATTADDESARLLQELVVSRNQRDAASTAAADAQAAADQNAVMAAAEAYRLAAEAARPKAVAPVNGARLTSGFGARWGTVHAGIDLAAPMRTPEYSVMDGVVLEAGAASGYGLAVYIQHDNGDVTVYGHMDEILVQPGQVVRAGDTIALLGNRGQSTGPHLHFEVHQGGLDGTKVDPIPWLRERGVNV